MPNPWDQGSARLLQGLGFQALATTSSGLAYTLGRMDGEVSLNESLQHCAELAAVTDVAINADLENGFADDPGSVAENVVKAAATGIAGCSIEDYCSKLDRIYDFDMAVERVQAAAEALALLEGPVLLTARAENLLHGVHELDDTIRRLQAFEAAGADVLYAPGISTLDQLQRVTSELGKPFNVLAPFVPEAGIEQLAAAGARRISVGGALNWAAVNTVITAGREMLADGTFNWTSRMAHSDLVKSLLGR
ncbi:MAG: isocitrate lyase/phosphoenolpyruvate mutase family protein [Gammaproteobacteria bacterium]|nr:isocitrate lyase/phosphoenolpyruvate mutase family protein [Gammaproteobacteria bacterium]